MDFILEAGALPAPARPYFIARFIRKRFARGVACVLFACGILHCYTGSLPESPTPPTAAVNVSNAYAKAWECGSAVLTAGTFHICQPVHPPALAATSADGLSAPLSAPLAAALAAVEPGDRATPAMFPVRSRAWLHRFVMLPRLVILWSGLVEGDALAHLAYAPEYSITAARGDLASAWRGVWGAGWCHDAWSLTHRLACHVHVAGFGAAARLLSAAARLQTWGAAGDTAPERPLLVAVPAPVADLCDAAAAAAAATTPSPAPSLGSDSSKLANSSHSSSSSGAGGGAEAPSCTVEEASSVAATAVAAAAAALPAAAAAEAAAATAAAAGGRAAAAATLLDSDPLLGGVRCRSGALHMCAAAAARLQCAARSASASAPGSAACSSSAAGQGGAREESATPPRPGVLFWLCWLLCPNLQVLYYTLYWFAAAHPLRAVLLSCAGIFSTCADAACVVRLVWLAAHNDRPRLYGHVVVCCVLPTFFALCNALGVGIAFAVLPATLVDMGVAVICYPLMAMLGVIVSSFIFWEGQGQGLQLPGLPRALPLNGGLLPDGELDAAAAIAAAVAAGGAHLSKRRGVRHWPPPLVVPPALEESGATTDAPHCFCCPITHTLMVEPAVTRAGSTYERSAILLWLGSSKVDPLTHDKLSVDHLAPNLSLRSAIELWLDSEQQALLARQAILPPLAGTPVPRPYVFYSLQEHVLRRDALAAWRGDGAFLRVAGQGGPTPPAAPGSADGRAAAAVALAGPGGVPLAPQAAAAALAAAARLRLHPWR